MAEPNGETPPPIGNTRRPILQERATRRNQKQSGGVRGLIGFLFRAGTLAAIVLGGVYLYQNVLTTPKESARPGAEAPGLADGAAKAPTGAAPKAGPEDLDAIQRRMELETAHGIERQQVATAKLKQRQAIALGESVYRVLDEWNGELEQWTKEVVPLSRNDQGKALAANNTLLRQYRAVTAPERPSRDEARRLKEQVEGLISVMKTASENPADASIPGTEITQGLQGLLKEAKAGRDKGRDMREQVASLVTQAADEGSKGEVTLAEAARKQQDEERRAASAVIEAERSKAEEEATRVVAKAKADQAHMAGQKQEAIVRAETEALSATKERERIRTLAESPAIQARFAPLFAKGRYSLNSSTPSIRAVPVSLGDLNRGGYLENVERFARPMCDSSPDGFGHSNDRPTFPKPRTEADWRRIEQDLAMFKQLGPTWVEMGKLMP